MRCAERNGQPRVVRRFPVRHIHTANPVPATASTVGNSIAQRSPNPSDANPSSGEPASPPARKNQDIRVIPPAEDMVAMEPDAA